MKKFICIIMFMVILVGLVLPLSLMTTLATNDISSDNISSGFISGVAPGLDPNLNITQYLNEIAETNKKIDDYMDIFHTQSLATRSVATNILAITLAQQTSTINCGPACIYMALRYIKPNNYPTMATLTAECDTVNDNGTIVYKATNVINSYLNSNETQYQYTTTTTSSFSSSLIYSIDKNRPVLCCINTAYLTQYPSNSSSAHYVLARGYKAGFSGQNYIQDCYYNDSNYNNSYYGQFVIEIPAMVTAISMNNDHYIRAS
ncbi:MAG: C39 family peptidase [Oscillospiraceae bacterium]|nr:C39 family peptidase [Oscillospiraceae bacterium]